MFLGFFWEMKHFAFPPPVRRKGSNFMGLFASVKKEKETNSSFSCTMTFLRCSSLLFPKI